MSMSDRYVTVRVATDLLAEIREWSQPVQAQVIETPVSGTGYEMIFRTLPDLRRQIAEEIVAEIDRCAEVLVTEADERGNYLTAAILQKASDIARVAGGLPARNIDKGDSV